MGFAFALYSPSLHLPKPRFFTKRANVSFDNKTSQIRYAPMNFFCKLKCNSTSSGNNNEKNSTSLFRNFATSLVERLSSIQQGWLFNNKVSKFIIEIVTFIVSLLSLIRYMTSYMSHSFLPNSPYSADGYARSLNNINRYRESKLGLITTELVKGTLPNAVKFDQLRLDSACRSCTVCLQEFGSEDEVRRLSNCGHVFHGLCLDGWMEQKRYTCPLCRVDLVREEFKEEFDQRMSAATAALDAYINSRFFSSSG